MTKKDYIIIAKVIKDNEDWFTDYDCNIAIGRIVEQLASAFAKDNSRFDEKRFKFACGYHE